jgi:hypothetical protein
VLNDGKAGTVENVWLDELHGLRISIKGHYGRWPISTIKFTENSRRTRRSHPLGDCPERAILSDHPNQDEKSDLGQESNAHDGDR